MKETAMKKQYMKPAMQVVKIQQTQIICISSLGAKGLGGSNPENFSFDHDGLDDDDV